MLSGYKCAIYLCTWPYKISPVRVLLSATIKPVLFLLLENIQISGDCVHACMEPQTFDKASQVSCLCFNFGSMNMMCNMPCTGFSPGDTIPISVHIENPTTKKYPRMCLQKQDILYRHWWSCSKPRKQFVFTQMREGGLKSATPPPPPPPP